MAAHGFAQARIDRFGVQQRFDEGFAVAHRQLEQLMLRNGPPRRLLGTRQNEIRNRLPLQGRGPFDEGFPLRPPRNLRDLRVKKRNAGATDGSPSRPALPRRLRPEHRAKFVVLHQHRKACDRVQPEAAGKPARRWRLASNNTT